MGYRSEVVIAISKDLMPHFLTVFAKEPGCRPMVFKDHDYMNEDYDGEGTFIVSWSGIKWYEGYPEVDALNHFIDKCDGDDIEIVVIEREVERISPQQPDSPGESVAHRFPSGYSKHLLREINAHDLSRLIILGKPDGYVTGAGTDVQYSVSRFCTGTPDQFFSPSLVDIQAEEMIYEIVCDGNP